MIAADWMWLQLRQLAVSILAGLLLGLCYDLYRGLLARARRFRQDYWWRDLLFGFCVILLALLLWFGSTDGSLRFSVFLWMAGAALLYRWSISSLLHPEKWLQHRQKRKKPPRMPKKPGRTGRKNPKQWNIAAARGALLLCRRLRSGRKKRKKTEAEEKI